VNSSFKIVKIDSDYCDYLRKFDNKVCFNAGVKNLRPFIGVLFVVEDMSITRLYLAQSQNISTLKIHLI
jgi:hypothetical protein